MFKVIAVIACLIAGPIIFIVPFAIMKNMSDCIGIAKVLGIDHSRYELIRGCGLKEKGRWTWLSSVR